MSKLKLVLTIVNRGYGERFMKFFEDQGISMILSTPAKGTASDDMLARLGLEECEKRMLYCFANAQQAEETFDKLKTILLQKIPGSGIAMTIPVCSVGGARTLGFLLNMESSEQNYSEEIKMDSNLVLIVAISNYGSIDLVMDAAREANATGGTTVHAKASMDKTAEKFFKMSIADEKEMIFILTDQENKANIMKSIMTKAGRDTPAESIVFTLPVEDVVGLELK